MSAGDGFYWPHQVDAGKPVSFLDEDFSTPFPPLIIIALMAAAEGCACGRNFPLCPQKSVGRRRGRVVSIASLAHRSEVTRIEALPCRHDGNHPAVASFRASAAAVSPSTAAGDTGARVAKAARHAHGDEVR